MYSPCQPLVLADLRMAGVLAGITTWTLSACTCGCVRIQEVEKYDWSSGEWRYSTRRVVVHSAFVPSFWPHAAESQGRAGKGWVLSGRHGRKQGLGVCLSLDKEGRQKRLMFPLGRRARTPNTAHRKMKEKCFSSPAK